MPDPVPPPLPPVPLPPSPEDLRRLADLLAQLSRWLADHWMPPLGPPIPVPPPPTPPPAPPGPIAGDTAGGDGTVFEAAPEACCPAPVPSQWGTWTRTIVESNEIPSPNGGRWRKADTQQWVTYWRK